MTPHDEFIKNINEMNADWVDGWIELDDIFYEPSLACSVLKVRNWFLSRAPRSFWLPTASRVPIIVDTVTVRNVTAFKKRIDVGEASLWLSRVEYADGECIFEGTQGSIHITTADPMVSIAREVSDTKVRVWGIFGAEWTFL